MDDSPYRAPNTQEGATDYSAAIAGDIRGMQIITAALMMGACIFMGITLFNTQGALGTEPDITSWIGIGFGILCFLLHLIVPSVMRARQLAQIDPQEVRSADDLGRFGLVAGVFRGTHIVACALLEGGVFNNLVFYMTTDFVGNLGAAVLLILCIAVRFPTEARVMTWVRNASDEIALR